jgi:hypothetical protein
MPEYTSRSQEIWREYQSHHDLGHLVGHVAAIDPQTGKVWIAGNSVDVAKLVRAEVGSNPVYLVEVGSDYFVRKGLSIDRCSPDL